ncbi:MAG: hypothetical protein IT473_15825 [Lysobacter sp.]|nr:hypothetical protein [Lysobacter sp.]
MRRDTGRQAWCIAALVGMLPMAPCAAAADDEALRGYLLRLHVAAKCKDSLPQLAAPLDAALAVWQNDHFSPEDRARLPAYAAGRAGRKAKADIEFLYANTAAGDRSATARSCVKTLHDWHPTTYPEVAGTRLSESFAQRELSLVAPLVLAAWACPRLDRAVAEQPPTEPLKNNDLFETWNLEGCGRRYALILRLHVEGLAQKIAIHDEDIADLIVPIATVREEAQ